MQDFLTAAPIPSASLRRPGIDPEYVKACADYSSSRLSLSVLFVGGDYVSVLDCTSDSCGARPNEYCMVETVPIDDLATRDVDDSDCADGTPWNVSMAQWAVNENAVRWAREVPPLLKR